MIVKSCDGREYKWQYKKKKKRGKKSKLHNLARKVISLVFPHDRYYEEVYIPSEKLYVDFWFPSRNLIVEVNGEQHYKFNRFHFKSKHGFYKAKRRDNQKRDWCEINGIDLIDLNYNESEEVWKDKLKVKTNTKT